jgi:hypothetical protein
MTTLALAQPAAVWVLLKYGLECLCALTIRVPGTAGQFPAAVMNITSYEPEHTVHQPSETPMASNTHTHTHTHYSTKLFS